ncbi:MAG: hypothetical protein WCK39_00125 [Methanomassiliicoccales archaeon]
MNNLHRPNRSHHLDTREDVGMIERDCLALLGYCARHQGEKQSQHQLGEACGMSQQRVCYLVGSVSEWGFGHSLLTVTAQKYGFSYKVIHGVPGQVIDVRFSSRTSSHFFPDPEANILHCYR